MATRDIRTVPMALWGKDHWATLAYVETLCVDHQGVLDPRRMRCNPRRHPHFNVNPSFGPDRADGSYKYPTMLKGGGIEPEHDDWDCFYDLETTGLIEDVGTGIHPVARLTVAGHKMAANLRMWKASGGSFATFKGEP